LPTDVLVQLLSALAFDGACLTWQQLAFLTTNNSELRNAAQKTERPLVVDICVKEDYETEEFIIPFWEAQHVRIRIDWGDGMTETILEPCKSAKHLYEVPGYYVVRIFPGEPHTDPESEPIWLDHLGWGLFGTEYSGFDPWSDRLVAVRSLGALGIRSLRCPGNRLAFKRLISTARRSAITRSATTAF
jgi:hypothetical protein